MAYRVATRKKWDVLERQQREPYFALVLNTAIDVLYRDAEVWEMVGYGGSSLEHGGYLTRGFDDISWLPKTSSETPQ